MKGSFKNRREAKVYVIECLISTLENDIDGNGSDYLYVNPATESDRKMAVEAARGLLVTLRKMATRRPRVRAPLRRWR
jgi:hypothetical protein